MPRRGVARPSRHSPCSASSARRGLPCRDRGLGRGRESRDRRGVGEPRGPWRRGPHAAARRGSRVAAPHRASTGAAHRCGSTDASHRRARASTDASHRRASTVASSDPDSHGVAAARHACPSTDASHRHASTDASHRHASTDASHRHGNTDASHRHACPSTDASHRHASTDASRRHGNTDASHRHAWPRTNASNPGRRTDAAHRRARASTVASSDPDHLRNAPRSVAPEADPTNFRRRRAIDHRSDRPALGGPACPSRSWNRSPSSCHVWGSSSEPTLLRRTPMRPLTRNGHLPALAIERGGWPLFEWLSGGVLLSHRVAPAVPSALRVLASGFGMGPGVSLALWPP